MSAAKIGPAPSSQADKGMAQPQHSDDSPNKAVVRRVIEEVWNAHDSSKAHELMIPDVRDHNVGPGESGGLEGFIAHHRDFMKGSTDLHITIEDMIEEGDRVVARLTWRGTHDGVMFGIPPSGKQIVVTNITIYRIVDGKINDVWRNQDTLGMLEQMGTAPPAGMNPIAIVGFVTMNIFRMGYRQFRYSRQRRAANAGGR